jgi:hypothetical protein
MQELWKPIKGFEDYEVSNTGYVRSWKTRGGRRPSPYTLAPGLIQGRRYVNLMRDGKAHHLGVSVLVLEAFGSPKPARHEAAHLDGDPGNSHLGNLQWMTRKEISAQRVLNGTDDRSLSKRNTKLTEADVLEIKARLNAGESHESIAQDYPVKWANIKSIHLEKSWSHVGTITRPFVPFRHWLTAEQRASVVAGIREGRTTTTVGADVGCDFGTVGKVFAEETGMTVRQYRKTVKVS